MHLDHLKFLGKKLLNCEIEDYLKMEVEDRGKSMEGQEYGQKNVCLDSGIPNDPATPLNRPHPQDCLACTSCVAKSHRILRYKYPDGLKSRYMEIHNLKKIKESKKDQVEKKDRGDYAFGGSLESRKIKEDTQNFNYDQIRYHIR